ncbi:Peptidase M10 serralysin C terminal [Azospirillum sp. RU38E]|jgi:hypothetical protein|nr:Peptidase M10 serralysin C terminal [Azospirillum sp. RU38E]SNS70782.1 Peptidase M10 serralysin C terminal [Azospirillum sp. RU37A]
MCVLCGNQQNQCLFSVEQLGTVPLSPSSAGDRTAQAVPALSDTPYFIQALVASYRGVQPHSGPAPVIVYGWLPDFSTGYYDGATNPSIMTIAQLDLARKALAQWEEVADIHFVEATVGVAPDIRFGAATMQAGGYAVVGGPVTDIWVNAQYATQQTFLHEIGHALGLKHPGNYNGVSGVGEPPFLPDVEDTQNNTVMSYNGDGYSRLGNFDIAAIQYLYGPNKTVRTGDDTYFVTHASTGYYIWDGGGNDTISAANSIYSVKIDLRDGHFGSFAVQVDNSNFTNPGQFFVGYGTLIENATGSSGQDLLTGNDLANRLDGSANDDTLIGGLGNDTLIGGHGEDTAVFSGNFADYTIIAGVENITVTSLSGEMDLLNGIEKLSFADRTTTAPPLLPPPPTVKPEPILTVKGSLVAETDAGGVSQLVFSIQFTDENGAPADYISDNPVSFQVTTGSHGTAAAGADYQPLTQRVTIAPGQNSATIAVNVLGNKIYDGNKTIELVVSDLQGAKLTGGAPTTSVYGLVVDNDIPPQFSITAYRALNPDVAAAYGNDATAIAWHYINYGRAEGRAASGFDPEAYAALNPDLFAAFGLNEEALINHYQQYGRAEGRAAYGFTVESYAMLNPDLYRAFGNNETALVQHYIKYGRAEGRPTLGFDVEAYVANDHQNYIEYRPNEDWVMSNFIQKTEWNNVATNGFSAETYAILNPDLLSIFGMDHAALIRHYQYAGYAEHRPAFILPSAQNLTVLGMVEGALT